MKRLTAYAEHSDGRGLFRGLTQQPWSEVNYIETRAGHTRGQHYHTTTHEMFYIIGGEIRIDLHNLQTGEQQTFTARAGDMFIVQPYEEHTFHVLTDAQWINFLSAPLDPVNPDFHRRTV